MENQSEKKENAFWGFIFPDRDDEKKSGKTTLLSHIPLFYRLSKKELKLVADIIHERKYESGEFMFEMGQPGAAMFIISKGSVNVVVPDNNSEDLVLTTLKSGTFVGELALMDDSPRSASARAAEPTEALAFFRTDLNKLLDTEPVIASKIFRELALIIGQRLKATNDQLYSKDRGKS